MPLAKLLSVPAIPSTSSAEVFAITAITSSEISTTPDVFYFNLINF